jgi:hypothetical protein
MSFLLQGQTAGRGVQWADSREEGGPVGGQPGGGGSSGQVQWAGPVGRQPGGGGSSGRTAGRGSSAIPGNCPRQGYPAPRGQPGGARFSTQHDSRQRTADRLQTGFRVLQQCEEEQMLPPGLYFLSHLV